MFGAFLLLGRVTAASLWDRDGALRQRLSVDADFRLVPEVPDAGEDHGETGGIGGGYDLRILD